MSSIHPDMQSLLDKMMLAGWASASSFQDKGEGHGVGGIQWTKDGIARLAFIAACIAEIEQKAGPITDAEMPYLRYWAQLIAIKNPSPQLPRSEPPGPQQRY